MLYPCSYVYTLTCLYRTEKKYNNNRCLYQNNQLLLLETVAVGWSTLCDCDIFLTILTYFLMPPGRIYRGVGLARFNNRNMG